LASIAKPKITMSTPVAAALRFSLVFLVSAVAYADSAQWNLNPASGDWNTADNWTPMTVPNGPADLATFGLSNTANVSISEDTEVNGIIFTSAATNPYTVTASPELTLTISGVGIKNNSGIAQKLVTAVDGFGNFGRILFTTSATAESCIFTNDGSTFASRGGSTEFYDSSTAANASFTNRSGSGTGTSATIFFDTSIAANGTFTNEGGGTGGTPFAEGGQTLFFDASTAGNGIFTNNGATASGGFGGDTVFDDSSSAGNGSFTNNGGTASGVAAFGGGATFFFGTSTAANGIFINNAAPASDAEGGVTEFGLEFFNFSPSAGNGTFINNGATVSGAVGGETIFNNASTADAATLIANGGTNGGEGGAIFFEENSTGGTARVEVFGNGILDVSGHNSPGVTIGSIEGEGDVFLGTNNLTVGSNNFSTTFSGVIQNGGFGASMTKIDTATLGLTEASPYNENPLLGRAVLNVYHSISSNTLAIQNGSLRGSVGGSLTKIGSGTLDLEGVNTYTGDTSVKRGVLQVDGSISGNTFVNWGGTLAGSGTVNGNVTNARGKISPGDALGEPGVLTVGDNYTQTAGGTLFIQIGGGNPGQVSVLDVQGNANLNGFLEPVLVNGFAPEIGQSFTFLNYASFTGFFHIRTPVFDHGRKRWLLAFNPTGAVLTAVENHRP
jgi:autotransporter-associated beta strand protein